MSAIYIAAEQLRHRSASLPAAITQACLCADGKVIDPKSVSVQSGKTYEEEFALQMAKAKVQPRCVRL